MSENIDILIACKEAEFSPHYALMEKLRMDFTHETILFAPKMFKIIAKEYVSNNAEHILDMGNEQLMRLKSKINLLVTNTEKTVKEVLNNPSFWWHLRPSSQDALNQYLHLDGKPPMILDQAVRQIVGRVGEILQEFHFHVTTRENFGSFDEYWFIKSTRGAIVPYYPHLLDWSVEMREIIQDYNTQYLTAIAIYKEIELLKEQKTRELALSRWDSLNL
jgi:hypothetical protein